jgi:hypothetical protein
MHEIFNKQSIWILEVKTQNFNTACLRIGSPEKGTKIGLNNG